MKAYECPECLKEYVDFRREYINYRFVSMEEESDWLPMNPLHMPTTLEQQTCPEHRKKFKL
jgi:hypothetical protein